MARPSNPRLMVNVLNAITHLGEAKGSTVKDILDYVRQTTPTKSKNLPLQVERALKNAVNACLLRHRSGRYKILMALSPVVPETDAHRELSDHEEDSPDNDPSKTSLLESLERQRRGGRKSDRGRSRSESRGRGSRRAGKRRETDEKPKQRLKRENSDDEAREEDRARNWQPRKKRVTVAGCVRQHRDLKSEKKIPLDVSDASDSSEYESSEHRSRKRRKTPARQTQRPARSHSTSSRRSRARSSSQHRPSQQQLPNQDGRQLDNSPRIGNEEECELSRHEIQFPLPSSDSQRFFKDACKSKSQNNL